MRIAIVAIIAALVIATALASSLTALAGDAEPLIAPLCPADLNGDRIVDSADLDRLLGAYGACTGCDADLNSDNRVDDADIDIMTQQWGPCPLEGDVFGGDSNASSFAAESDSSTGNSNPAIGPDKYRTTTTLDQSQCEGDLNGDTLVNEADMARVLRHYGACAACEEDLNKDGFVDDFDAQIIDRQWGSCSPEGDYFGGDHSRRKKKHKASDGGKNTPENVNGDDFVDMVDILTVANHMGQETTDENALSDVNDDGRIDEYDIRAIAEYVISGVSLGR